MKVDNVWITTRTLPRRDRQWQTSSYKASEVVGLYVGLEVEGVLAVGASCAHPRSLPPEVMTQQVEEVLRPALEGRELEELHAVLGGLTGLHSRTRLAVDLALHDLVGKRAVLPAEVVWGGPVRDRVHVMRMVGLKEPEAVTDFVAPLYDAGFRAFKIKIGDGVDRDVQRLRNVRRRFGDDVALSADANGHYSYEEGRALCEQVEELGLYCLEQPLGYDDVDGMVRLRAGTSVRLMADQMVRSARDAARIAGAGAADLISLKITKAGSIAEAVRIIDVCSAFGVQVHLGGCAGPSIVDSAIARLALAHTDISEYVEAGESLALVDDQIGGSVFEGADVLSDGRPGLGGRSTVFES